MVNNSLLKNSLMASFIGLAGIHGPVAAQVEEDAATRSNVLEEVTVTAQKRAENLQDVPIAITAFNQDSLEAIGASTIDSIVPKTPNFTMTSFNIGEPQFYLRGVGSSSDSASADPTVAVFLDEVYVGRGSSASFELFDLERIEVLRGPQGTLYGRNTSGGAINIITRKPSQEFEGKVKAVYGNFNRFDIAGAINTPLNDVTAIRGTVSYRTHDGYSENIVDGRDLMDEENLSSRIQLLTSPTDELELLLSADYSKDSTKGNARVPYPVNSDSPVHDIVRGIYPEETSIRRSFANPDSFQDREIWGLTARINYEARYGNWTSITSYRETDLDWWDDVTLLPPPWPLTVDYDFASEQSNQFTQEVRLSSLTDSELRWVVGAYYFDESVDRNENFVFGFTFAPAFDGDVSFLQDASSKSRAAFGQITYPIRDALSITAGIRYTSDEKKVRQTAINNLPGDPTPGFPLFPGQPYDVYADETWDAVTGRIGAEYVTSNGQLIYASFSKGYKSGQFPSQANSVATAVTPIKPETILNYEVGLKTDLLDRRLRLNTAVFLSDYEDLQLFRLDGSLRLETFNATADIYGVEAEFVAVPTENLELGGSVSYLNATVKGTSIGLYADNDLPRSPNWSGYLYADLKHEAPGGTVSIRGDYSWTDDYFHEIQNSPVSLIRSHGLLGARIAYTHHNSGIEVALWGKNLTDEEYRTHTIEFLGVGFSLFGPPRTYGVTISRTF